MPWRCWTCAGTMDDVVFLTASGVDNLCGREIPPHQNLLLMAVLDVPAFNEQFADFGI